MSPRMNQKRLFIILGKILIVALLIAAVIVSGRFADFMEGHGLIFVLLGTVATVLMSFTGPEIGAAFKHAVGVSGEEEDIQKSILFWESAGRNGWMLGVAGSVIYFVLALSSSQAGIAGTASQLATSFVPAIYGMILAVICLVPAWKLTIELKDKQREETKDIHSTQADDLPSPFCFEHLIGYILFIAVVAWAIIKPSLSNTYPLFKPWEWITNWPALLVVLGGTLIIVLFVNHSSSGRTWTLSFALTGLIGSFMGFIQVMLGFAGRSIGDIANAVAFVLSSCFVSLLGMLLVGIPLEDRRTKISRAAKPSPLSRVAWYVFPLVTLIFLALAFVLVITPMEQRLEDDNRQIGPAACRGEPIVNFYGLSPF